MIGVILFDNHDDLIFVFGDDDFKRKIKHVADDLEISSSPPAAKGQVTGKRMDVNDSDAVMQMFSPLLASYRVMNHEFQNSYDGITCEDGSTVAFYEHMNYLLVAVARAQINAMHLVRVCLRMMQHVVGPAFSMLKHSCAHSELVTLLIGTFLTLRQKSHPIATESLQYLPITEDANTFVLEVLEGAVEDLIRKTGIQEGSCHILIIMDTSIVALYSGKGAHELETDEIIFLVVAANSFAHSNSSTRNNLVVLESCVPYSIHIQRHESGIGVVILMKTDVHVVAGNLQSLIQRLTSPDDSLVDLPKRISELQKAGRTLGHRHWSDTLLPWQPKTSGRNQSAKSTLARQMTLGYELMCLNPSLLFTHVEHVSTVINIIQSSVPSRMLLAQPCPLTPLLQIYPGLVHFVLVDRIHHRMIAPGLPIMDQHDATFADMWQIFHTSFEWLNEGVNQLLWNDKQLCYSHRIWVEDSTNRKLAWKSSWDSQTVSLGYPSNIGSHFYKNLLRRGVEDEEAQAVHFLQLFCIHLGLTSPSIVLEQAKHLANHLKRFIYPATNHLEDLF